MPNDEDDERKRQMFYSLMERYCALGRLLPEPSEMDSDSDVESIRLVLREMEKCKAAIDAMLQSEAA